MFKHMFSSREQFYTYCESAALASNPNIIFMLDRKSSMNKSSMDVDDSGQFMVKLNVGELELQGRFHPVSNRDAVWVLQNLGHELWHVNQETNERGPNPDVRNLLNVVVFNDEDNHVLYLANYEKNSREIDAEYHGFLWTYDRLCELQKAGRLSKHLDCERLVLDCVNERVDSRVKGEGMYFIGQHCSSLAEVQQRFVDAYTSALNAPHRYPGTPDRKLPDEILHITRRGREAEGIDYEDHFRAFQTSQTGLQSDMMAASLMVHAHPELYKEYPGLRGIDLSSKAVFGFPFPEEGYRPETQAEKSERLHREREEAMRLKYGLKGVFDGVPPLTQPRKPAPSPPSTPYEMWGGRRLPRQPSCVEDQDDGGDFQP